MRVLPALTVLAVLSGGLPASAGEVGDFEAAMRSVYADYRAALFQTNANNQAESAAALAKFTSGWSTIAGKPVPAHYADDAQYAAMLAKVKEIAAQAAGQIGKNDLAAAHETLEAIRDQIAGLRERNGIVTFSDRMNAYHAKMEDVLNRKYDQTAEGSAALREDAAVLAYLAADIVNRRPADADPASFQSLIDAMKTSTAALLAAARSNDPTTIANALKTLKPAYSRLFLKFG